MIHLTDEQKIEYLKRSYSAVDGLWFMKVEEQFGFEKTLETDRRVWEITPKIQARFLKNALGLEKGLEALRICFTEKLRLDGCDFEIVTTENSFTVLMDRCSWHETMIRSGRERLSGKIGNTICATEYAGWAKEFGKDISCIIPSRICDGAEKCIIKFSR